MISQTIKTLDNELIECDLYNHGHRDLVVIAHGFCTSKEALLFKELKDDLADRFDVMIFDFRGHGKSSGLFYWTSREYLDLDAVLNDVRKKYDKVVIIGFSLGAATAIISASRRQDINAIVAISAPSELYKINYQFWKINFAVDIRYNMFGEGQVGKGLRPGPFWLKKEKPIERIEHIRCPILYIHGTNDWLILSSHSEELFEKTRTKKHLALIQSGPHAEYLFLTHKKETLAAMKDWLNKIL